jgi:ferredoxin
VYTRIYVLRFPKEIIDQPIICALVRQFDVDFNLLKATILPQNEGVMVIELRGHKTNIKKGLTYLKEQGVKAERLATGLRRDEEKCFQCGACTGICPTGALAIRRPDMAVLFDPEKCSGCGLCVTLCPVRAMEVSLDNSQMAA